MLPTSDAYTLKIRQGPERARVTGVKEKDRKPVDPPPIIQLHVRDVNDPAQNYLQSPYFFMCCSLWAASEERSALSTHADPQSTLAGTIVSSLHRLKDIDNTDGGFFVFGDLSVKLEGEYRLQFSLYEMCKYGNMDGTGSPQTLIPTDRTEVTFLKSIVSDTFTVYSTKSFPGMSESTFLSRSFGDQGVRLRIRKETRTLLKRPVPPSLRPEDYPQRFSQASLQQNSLSTAAHSQSVLSSAFSAVPVRDYPSEFSEPSAKRRRTLGSDRRDSYNRDPGYNPRFSVSQPSSCDVNPSQGQQPSGRRTPEFGQAPLSAPAGNSDFTFRYPQTENALSSSPFASPRSQIPNFGPASQQMGYQQNSRYPSQTYLQGPFVDMQTAAIPRSTQSLPITRHGSAVEQLQGSGTVSYANLANSDNRSDLSVGSRQKTAMLGDDFFQYPSQLPTDQMIRPQQHRYSMPNASLPNLLPPLQPTMSSMQPLLTTMSTYNNYIALDDRLPGQPSISSNFSHAPDRFGGYSSTGIDGSKREEHEPG